MQRRTGLAGNANASREGFRIFQSASICVHLRFILLFLSLALTACAPPPSSKQPPLYTGPTLSMDQVVAKVNANADKLGTIWASHDFEGNLADDKGAMHFVNGYGVILYRAPGDLRITCQKEITSIFDIGINAERYWVNVYPGTATQWWGYTANIGKPCAQAAPIRPDMLREVLGVGRFAPDLSAQPAPVMRFNPDSRVYMFVWSSLIGGHWLAQKEIWYDMNTFTPVEVFLFDTSGDNAGKGRVAVRAYLSDFQPVAIDGVAAADQPVLARKYRLLFPDNGSHMSFDLKTVRTTFHGAPNDRSFAYRGSADMQQVIQLDANCQ